MKRLLTLAAMFLCCVATAFAQFSGSGSGTENDPYLILNPIQLNQMRNFLNTEDVYFKLMADVDLTDFLEDESPSQGWQPVGNSSSAAFKGILDGNGHKISGLWINRSGLDYVGLFGYTSGATIKNLTMKDVNVLGNNYVGALAGNVDAIISGNVITGIVEGNSYVGGGCGSGGKYNDNVSYAIVKGKNNVGGLVGYTSGVISNCHVIYANIFGEQSVGGIVGYCYGQSIVNCFFIGNVKGHSNIGGLAGATNNKIEHCYSLGNIEASGNNVGGLVGKYESGGFGNCESSFFYGSVFGEECVGGLFGYLINSVYYCYSRATVKGTYQVGGIAGYMGTGYMRRAIVYSCVASNIKVTALNGNVGRIYGDIEGDSRVGALGSSNENKSYNKTIVIKAGVALDIVDNEQDATGVSATTLRLKATYVAMGWDFTDTWAIQDEECYPYFKTQTAPPVITSQLVSGATVISGKCVDGGIVTLEVDGVTQQKVSTGNSFSFTVSPLQAGHEVRISAKAEGKEASYYTTETVAYLGSGKENDPYQVYTTSDLTGVYRKGYFKLMNDIDLTDYINQFSPTEGWESIGREGSETIHFDGNGHKITGLWCNSTRDNTGLFSCFANGTIKNLTVEVASGKQVKGGENTGILIGKMINGTIENCKVSGKVADGTPVGGMVGLFTDGSITRCQATVTITTTGATSYVGGLVGEMSSGTIDQCVTTGTLTATGATSYVGGLIGLNHATVTNCYSSAIVTSSYNAAGLVAYNYGVVDMCYAIGDINSNNYAAGVIGYNDGADAVVRNSVAMNNKIDVTYESQQVQQGGGYGQRIIGGIKNGAPSPEMNNYALKTMQVSLNDIPQKVYDDIMNGTAKTAAELKQKTTYQELNWDFDNVWNIDEETSYPYQTVKVDGDLYPDKPSNPDSPQGEVEVTDLSAIDNVIYMEPLEVTKGTEVIVPLQMKNTAQIRGFQFDLYLPIGVTVAKGNNGRYVASLSSGRLPEGSAHTLTVSQQDDGAIRFLCGSQYDETFTGTEGEVATVKLCFDESMEDGQYPIVLKNVKLTETNINNFYLTETVQTALTVIAYTPGDISGDGVIDVSDYIGVANYILGEQQEGIIPAAADVNKDQVVDVSDYIGVANLILYNSIYGPTANASRGRMNRSIANTDISEIDNVLYIEPLETTSATELQLSLKMKNTAQIRGFQVDVYLPEGVTAVKNNNGRIVAGLNAARLPDGSAHTLTVSERPDGAIRLLCGSQYDETFTGTDGEIATLTINVGADVEAGNYPLTLAYVKLTGTDIKQSYLTGEVGSSFMVLGEPNGITSTSYANETDDYYDLQGRRVTPVKKGIYIRNGQKIIVK